METILTILVIGALCIVCFFVGSKLGQTVAKGKDIEVPSINPMQIYQKQQEKKLEQDEKNKVDIILRNIERYDGTANGQEDVPRG